MPSLKGDATVMDNCSSSQLPLVKPMLVSTVKTTVFSVYKTECAIELHSGCNPRMDTRLISTHRSYDDACNFAEFLAVEVELPLKNFTQERSRNV
ncbi:MAG: hypothetical protein HC866_01235 [Leptolyngbyaceae cyanobacterium RU_5_1]|nr:hypothetical protein [Leptolyngbyaceae cyanobacterium RU_5_1]